MLQVDDLIQPRLEQIVRSRRLVLLGPYRSLRCTTESQPAAEGTHKLQGFWFSTSHPCNLKRLPSRKTDPPQSLRGLFTDDFLSSDSCLRLAANSPVLDPASCSRSNAIILLSDSQDEGFYPFSEMFTASGHKVCANRSRNSTGFGGSPAAGPARTR